MLTSSERSDICVKVARRIVSNLEDMQRTQKLNYIESVLRLIDDAHLEALSIAIEVTSKKEGTS